MSVFLLSPWSLLLFAPALLLALLLAARSRAGLPPFAARLSFFLRMVIVTLVVLALAEPVMEATSERAQVVFVLDRSQSIPSGLRETGLLRAQVLAGRRAGEDRTALVVFGRQAGVEKTLSEDPLPRELRARIEEDATSIAEGVSLARSLFLEGGRRKIVLISDGNENRGRALDAVRDARKEGIVVDASPLLYRHSPEVRVDKVLSPQRVRAKEPFEIKVVLEATEATTATVRLLQDGTPVAESRAEVTPGANALVLSRTLTDPGFHGFEVIVEADGDTLSGNNAATTFTTVVGEPRILHVVGEEPGPPFVASLGAAGLTVVTVRPEQLPANPEELAAYDVVLLTNVGASRFTRSQMECIAKVVHATGTGLVVTGGDASFAAGGYAGTPLEDALPVHLETNQRKVLPKGALVIVLHTCEFPDGNAWAREIAKAALSVLSPRDLFGVVTFDPSQGGDVLSLPLAEVGDGVLARNAINGVTPGDMPAFDPGLVLARDALAATDAAVKHVIVISDGDPSRPRPETLDSFLPARITVSTVGINPHTPDDVMVLQAVAGRTGGTYTFARSPAELPRIFLREAAVVRRSALLEERIDPVVTGWSSVLEGVFTSALPAILGLVLTSDKATAETVLSTPDGDPLLALGRHGLGTTVAFTSDADLRWCGEWTGWEGYVPLFTRLVRHAAGAPDATFELSAAEEGGSLRVVLDAVDDRGELVTDLVVTARVLDSALAETELALTQVEPGRYAGLHPIFHGGVHLVRVAIKDKGDGPPSGMTTGIVASLSPELRDASSNIDLLATLAREGGGALLTGNEDVFTFEGRAEDAARELFPPLLWAALCLFPVDILVRRLAPAGWRKKRIDEDGAADPGEVPPVVEEPSPAPDDTAGRLLAAKKRLSGRTRRSK